MKKILKIIAIVLLVIVLIFACFIFYMTRGLETGENLTINEVDLASLDDNTYIGKYHGGRWSNELEITIKDHQIISIHVLKDVKFPNEETTNALINRVVQEQKVDVDAISGATVTCNAYLKSMEDALK